MPTRRTMLALLGGATACARSQVSTPYSVEPVTTALFQHGVASGDPRTDSVILWTRISPAPGQREQLVFIEIADDPDFSTRRRVLMARTGPEQDWTVKLVADGLLPGRTYYYRFTVDGEHSPIGRTRTTPNGKLERLRLAVVSCANHAQGYFNVYSEIARIDDLDAVIHLGDYIYEYGATGYAGADKQIPGRQHQPARETVTLADYRTRHAQYKRDPALQALHAAHPVIPVWDDHEFTNDAWADGAENHQPDEGDWLARIAAAKQAYLEWMPVRDMIRPAFRFGDLASLHTIETRVTTRDRSYDSADLPGLVSDAASAEAFRARLADPAREKIGQQQLARLQSEMTAARDDGVTWTLLANPTLLTDVRTPDISPYLTPEDRERALREWTGAEGFLISSEHGLPLFMDAWDGYPAERERLYDAVSASGAERFVVLTGDSHAWWANDLTRADGTRIGVELATSSVTATSAFSKDNLGDRADDVALLINRDNPSVRYLSGRSHGFMDLIITRDSVDATFRAVPTIIEPTTGTYREAAFSVHPSRRGGVILRSQAGLGFREWWLFQTII